MRIFCAFFATLVVLHLGVVVASREPGLPPKVKEAKRSAGPIVLEPSVGYFESPFVNLICDGLLKAIREGDTGQVRVHVSCLQALSLEELPAQVTKALADACSERGDEEISDHILRFFHYQKALHAVRLAASSFASSFAAPFAS